MAQRENIKRTIGAYKQPLPMGAKIGNIVCSSSILGWDPQTKEVPGNPDRQAEFLFQHIKDFTERAGGNPANLIYMLLEFKPERYMECIEAINKEWVKMFPDENNRPARHSIAWIPLEPGGSTAYFRVELVLVL